MSDTPVEKEPPRAPCYEYQNDHISAEEFFEQIDATPNSELQELIEEWRVNMDIDGACGRIEAADRWGQAADELEALIADDPQAGDGDE